MSLPKLTRSVALCCLFLLTGCPSPRSPESELRFPIPKDPPTLDSAVATDPVSLMVLGSLEEGLTTLDRTGNSAPGLAERWEKSPDGKQLIFHLRDGKWSDGVPLTAKDFAFAWKRRPDDPELQSVTAADDHTLQVTLSGPTEAFLARAASASLAPQRRDITEANPTTFSEPPQLRSTGPYRLTAWKHGSSLFLEPNPYYHGQKPAIAQLYFEVVSGSEAAQKMLKESRMDGFFVDKSGVPHFEEARKKKAP